MSSFSVPVLLAFSFLLPLAGCEAFASFDRDKIKQETAPPAPLPGRDAATVRPDGGSDAGDDEDADVAEDAALDDAQVEPVLDAALDAGVDDASTDAEADADASDAELEAATPAEDAATDAEADPDAGQLDATI